MDLERPLAKDGGGGSPWEVKMDSGGEGEGEGEGDGKTGGWSSR